MQFDFNKRAPRPAPRGLVLGLVVALGVVCARPAPAEVRVVATVPSLGALVSVVGGEHVTVSTLVRPSSDPHFIDGRPSYVVALRRADLLVHVGLDLEVGWLPRLLVASRNSAIQRGDGNLNASTVAGPLLGVGASTDRQLGDVHAGGNPHYLLDPRMAVNVALGIMRRLIALDPDNASAYKRNAAGFKKAMAQRIAGWSARMKGHKGKPIVSYHDSVPYLARFFGLNLVGHVEPLPGVPPTPKHLAGLIANMKRHGAKVVFSEAWYDAESARAVARETGATLIRMPGDVGAPGIGTYADLIETIVARLEKAL